MNAILHRIEIKGSPDAVYRAVSEQSGLAKWWTPMVEATPEVGSTARFRFGDGKHGPDMEVTALTPAQKVAWRCVDGPWLGHEFQFDIRPSDKGAVLLFAHRGWAEADEFYMHCNAKWGYFLGTSLKSYVETGTGAAHPADPDL